MSECEEGCQGACGESDLSAEDQLESVQKELAKCRQDLNRAEIRCRHSEALALKDIRYYSQEITGLKEEIMSYRERLGPAGMKMVMDLKAENKKMRAALTLYATKNNWDGDTFLPADHESWETEPDSCVSGGMCARQALNPKT